MWCSFQITPVCIICNSGPVTCDQCTAVFHKRTNLFGKTFLEHINHWKSQYFIFIQFTGHIDHIHIDALLTETSVEFQHCFQIMKPFISGSLAVLHCPLAVPVVKHGNRAVHSCSCQFSYFFQSFSNSGNFFKHSCIISTVMIDHCSVELLRSTSALANLEIESTFSAMCNCLHGLCKKHSRFL